MNPDQAWIGKVFFVGIVGLVIWGITALMQAKSEAARRVRIILGSLLALGIGAILFAVGGPGLLAGAIIAIAAITWIVKGFKK